MFTIISTDTFKVWLDGLEAQARMRIAVRLARFESGLFGDAKSIGDGLSEARIDYAGGFRLYFVVRQKTIIVLLCGGEKKSQARDIKLAKKLAKEV